MESDAVDPSSSLSHDELMVLLRETFTRLDRWRMVIASRAEPVPGSELAEDDRIWPWAPPTSLCLASLGNAREHLHAVRLLVDHGELFPSVTSTLARSALMSSSVAVWMLAPKHSLERHRRMLSFALEDYRNHIASGRETTESFHPDDVRPEAAEQISRLRARLDEVKALLEPLGGPYKWNMTDVVIPAALRETTSDERQRAQFASRWRVMSGAAHGLIWPHFGAPGTSFSELDSSGIGQVTVGGSVDTLVIDYFTAFHVTARAWSLFAERSGLPGLAQ